MADAYICGIHIELAPDHLLLEWDSLRRYDLTPEQYVALVSEICRRKIESRRRVWFVDYFIGDEHRRPCWLVESRLTHERIVCESEGRCAQLANLLNAPVGPR